MKATSRRSISTCLAAGMILFVSSTARAATVAGWDFSQWVESGLLSINNTSLTNTLAANYSNLDPTNNAGAESAAFGKLYFNGQFGSTAVAPVGDGSEAFTPSAGSLVSNIDGPVSKFGDNPFDSLQILAFEGQEFTELLSMAASKTVQVVFAATPGRSASSWVVTFGARATAPSNLGVEFSTDGSNYAVAGSVALTTGDTRYELNLGAAASTQGYVRFRFTPPAGGAQLIDNVAIQAAIPLPGDRDGDGIPDATDKCPYYPSANQTDTDGDGRGDVCECTDQDGDGRNTVADLVAINTAIFNPALVTPLCDGNNDGRCDVGDIIAANIEIFSPTNTSTCSRQPVPGP